MEQPINIPQEVREPIVEYFGTDLQRPGHYRWQVNDKLIMDWKKSLFFEDLDFDPEKYPVTGMNKGDHLIFQTGKYTVYFISGSPVDKRSGCKSVFFVKGFYSADDLIAILKKHTFFNEVVKILTDGKPTTN